MKTVLSSPVSLSIGLRQRTRQDHAAAEAAFDLDARVADLGAYTALLILLRRFYGPAEDAIAAVKGWEHLSPPIDVRSRRRAALLDDDLRHLGIGTPASSPGGQPLFRNLGGLAPALGCLYVLEGSTLGGQILARRARAALGEHLPVTFFSGSGRGEVGPRWRALQAALDAFGSMGDEPGLVDQTVAAAKDTFAALAWRLRRSVLV